MTTAQAAAADLEIDIAGKKYKLARFTGREWGEFDQYLAGRILERTRLATAEMPNPDPFVAASVALAARIDSRMCTDPDVRAVITALWNSREGTAEHARLMLRKSFPPPTREMLLDLLEDPAWSTPYHAAVAAYLNPPKNESTPLNTASP